jgi:hypothetical protein
VNFANVSSEGGLIVPFQPKKIQQETINENRDFFSTPQWIFSFFSQNSIRIFHVLRSVPVQTSRLGSRTGGLTMGICWSYP